MPLAKLVFQSTANAIKAFANLPQLLANTTTYEQSGRVVSFLEVDELASSSDRASALSACVDS